MKKFIRIFLFLACAFAFSQSSWADQHKGGKGKALGKGTGECMQKAGDAKKECLEEQMEHRDEMKKGKGKKDKKAKKKKDKKDKKAKKEKKKGKKDKDDDEDDD